MSFIHIKKQKIKDANGTLREIFTVQALAINSPQGKKLIPNPAGSETCTFKSFDDAVSAVRRTGFDYIYEGKKTYLMDASHRPKKRVRTGLDAFSDAIPILLERLDDKEASVISHAVFALGELEEESAILPFMDILGHEDSNVRKALAEALSKIGRNALPHLETAYQAAKDNKEKYASHIRLTVMAAYLEITHTRRELLTLILPQAVEALEDENWMVRSQAALVVGRSAQYFRDDRLQQDS